MAHLNLSPHKIRNKMQILFYHHVNALNATQAVATFLYRYIDRA